VTFRSKPTKFFGIVFHDTSPAYSKARISNGPCRAEFRLKSQRRLEQNALLGVKGESRSSGLVGMDKAEKYRRYAVACLRIAQQTQDLGMKASLLQMAETWRRLTERAEVRATDETC
jgi:hypothetical protein